MVLLAGPGPEGGGGRRVSPQTPSPPRDAQAGEDPGDYEEYEDFSCLPDTRSIASDDSFYPVGGEEEYGTANAESVPEGVPEEATLLRAACANDVGLLRALVRRGPSAEEVQETDRNGRVSWRPRRLRIPSALPPVPRRPGPAVTVPLPSARLRRRLGVRRVRSPGRPCVSRVGVAVWAVAGVGGAERGPRSQRRGRRRWSRVFTASLSVPAPEVLLSLNSPAPTPGARARIRVGDPSAGLQQLGPLRPLSSLPAGTKPSPEPQLPSPPSPAAHAALALSLARPERGRAPPGPRESEFPPGSPAPLPQPPARRRREESVVSDLAARVVTAPSHGRWGPGSRAWGRGGGGGADTHPVGQARMAGGGGRHEGSISHVRTQQETF